MRHPAWQTSTITNSRDRARDAVRRIAETLGCSVERLTQAARLEAYPDEVAELVRLWFKIEDPAARRALLAQIQKASEQ